MTPEDIVATLGYFCGSGHIEVRHGEDWQGIYSVPIDGLTWIDAADLFLILTAEEVRT